MSDVIVIRKRKSGETGVEQFAIPAMPLQTPQGQRLIPHPQRQTARLFDTLAQAEETLLQAGYIAEFEGRRTYPKAISQQAKRSQQATLQPGISLSELAIPKLIECLSDPESVVIGNAAYALGSLEVDTAAVPLCRLLGHDDAGVRKQVVEALARLGDPAIPSILSTWQREENQENRNSPYVRLSILTICSSIAERTRNIPSALGPVVLSGLSDSHWLVRAQAALALGHSASNVL